VSIEKVLASVCKDLRLLGDKELTSKALCAYAAVTDTENPKVDLSYSAVMRELRKGEKERQIKFQRVFKDTFDKALYSDLEEPQAIALMEAVKAIDYKEDDA